MGKTTAGKDEQKRFFKDTFRLNLKRIRLEKGLSQNDVAKKLDYPVSTYANWEQGRTEPGVSDIAKLLSVLHTEANELFATDRQ